MSTYDRAIARWEGEGGGPRFVAQPDGQQTDGYPADCGDATPSARTANVSTQTQGAQHVSDA